MATLLSMMLVMLSMGVVMGKFLNQHFVLLPNYTASNYMFYYENQLIVGLDSYNNPVSGQTSFIGYYDLQGLLLKKYPLPYQCSILTCNTYSELISLQGSILTLVVLPDASRSAYAYVSFDLDKEAVVLTNNGASFNPSGFRQISSTEVLVSVNLNNRVEFATLDLATLTASSLHPTTLNELYLRRSVMVDSTLYACALFSRNGPGLFAEMSLPSFGIQNTHVNCTDMTGYSSTQNQILVSPYLDNNVKLGFIEVSSSGLHPFSNQLLVETEAYVCDLASSENYAFVAVRFWENQDTSHIYQIATKLGSGIVLDSLEIPNGYLITGGNPTQHGQVNEEQMIYSIVVQRNSNDNQAIFIATFDGN